LLKAAFAVQAIFSQSYILEVFKVYEPIRISLFSSLASWLCTARCGDSRVGQRD
jgi:hypothetical protein